ncbi:unnamed protein product [Musa textilis]
MAACSSAAAVLPTCDLRRSSVSLRSSRLSAFGPPRVGRPRRLATGTRRLSALPQRRVLPRLEAKKQSFASFDELLEKCDKPLLVDFYATWCGPCQYMVSVLEEVSEKMKDQIQVIKIDTEKYTASLIGTKSRHCLHSLFSRMESPWIASKEPCLPISLSNALRMLLKSNSN